MALPDALLPECGRTRDDILGQLVNERRDPRELHLEIVRERHGTRYEGRDGETVTLFVLEDGLTAPGRVLRRGDELEISVGSPDWADTVDIESGASWIDLSPDEQSARWGRPMFSTVKPDIWPPPSEAELAETPEPDPAMEALAAAWREEDALARQPFVTHSRTIREWRPI